MKFFKRVICIVLSLVFMLQLLTGCSSKKTDETLYITKGEFFAYYVYENGMTSDQYTAEDIQNCEDGSVEADIIVEWGYLSEDLAKKNLKKPVEKEIVVMVCANATFDLKKGNPADIKDSDLLNDPQLIADAYASGFFELENGYFDGAEHMSFADCEAIMNKAKEYTADFHYDANTEITSTAEGVKEQDNSNYSDGDIVIEFFGDESESQKDSGASAEGMSYNTADNNAPKITFLNANTTPRITTLESKTKDVEVTPLANNADYFGFQNIKGFSATIMKHTFENALGNPQIGDTVVLNRFQVMMTNNMGYGNGEIIGILVDKKATGSNYICMFEYPQFEEAVQKKNVEKANGSGIDISSFVKEKTEVDGWKLEFEVTGNSIKVDAKKNFTVYETGRKQDWQNAKQTMTATANLEIGDFNLDVNNLKSFANKNGKGYIKITCDTDIGFSLSQSLRYTPDSNRNGKFPSNWSNSRWTDADSKGAKTIKIARFTPSLYGVVGIDVYIYLLISVDGKVSFTTSIENGGVQITANNGKISTTKLGTKQSEFSANVNLHNRLGVDASLKIFGFINVIEYDVGADLDLHAVVNLYYEEELSKSGVYADEEGLNEYAADDDKFDYCIGVLIELGVSGQMKDSGVKMILNLISKGESLDFEKMIWSGGFHFEDGSFVDKCTRGDDMADELKESDGDEVELGAYKVILEEGKSDFVWLKAIPSETMDLLDSKNSITVKSNNTKVCTATYNKTNKLIIVEAVGEGSTEIVIKAKKGMWWWKKTCEQKVSVTVNPSSDVEVQGMSYIIIDPSNITNLYYV
ncbi:MAG: hypothetical protein Q4B61_06560 [Bacteroidales bacterium]|nr:hypothetical protein [Bacteroidales bacterium]